MAHSADYTPNDPHLGLQPHLDAMFVQEAWAVNAGSSEVVVQVIDTGMDMDHPDLQVNRWINLGEEAIENGCSDGLDNDGNGFIDDCYG